VIEYIENTYKRILIILGFFLFIPNIIISQGNIFEISKGIKYAYSTINELKLDRAQHIIDSLKKVEPQNMLVYHIENYIDFYRIFINEDYNEFVELEKNKKYRLKKISSGDKNSPYYRFSKAEIELMWALIHSKFEENFTAFKEIKAAYKLLEKNLKKHPDFIENYKSLSVLHALIGTLPNSITNGIFKFFAGVDGTISQGADEIEKVVEYSKYNDFLFKEEAFTIKAFIAFHLENKSKKSWNTILSANLNTDKSPLASFVLANIAQKTGHNDFAIDVLKKSPKGKEYFTFHYLDYMMGRSLLYKNDSSAINYLKSFVENFNGINYIKDAYLKIAWFELILNNNENAYRDNIGKCISRGKKVVDEDKAAYKIAKSGIVPNPVLLKARLLFDGAYYFKAYSYLIQHEKEMRKSQQLNIEFTYRMGRILQLLDSDIEAIKYFEKSIDIGTKTDSHFACSSALQTAIIYEKLKIYKRAKKYYELCLDINPDRYRYSTHQKAKAGLIRILK